MHLCRLVRDQDRHIHPNIQLLRPSALSLQLVAGAGLCGRKPGSEDSEWRAGYVIHSHLMAELDRRGVASMLAADANFQLGTRLPPAFNTNPHQFSHAIAVD